MFINPCRPALGFALYSANEFSNLKALFLPTCMQLTQAYVWLNIETSLTSLTAVPFSACGASLVHKDFVPALQPTVHDYKA